MSAINCLAATTTELHQQRACVSRHNLRKSALRPRLRAPPDCGDSAWSSPLVR